MVRMWHLVRLAFSFAFIKDDGGVKGLAGGGSGASSRRAKPPVLAPTGESSLVTENRFSAVVRTFVPSRISTS